jgi:UDP-N-acetylmuramyl tripeptide synthase
MRSTPPWDGPVIQGMIMAEDTKHEAVEKRANDVIADIVAGRVIRPTRKALSDALDRAKSGDKVVDAIGSSKRGPYNR